MNKKSKWFWWCFVPYFNWAAWIHAFARSNNRRYVFLAMIYSIPFITAAVVDGVVEALHWSEEKQKPLQDGLAGVAIVFWIAGIVHVMLQKDSVDLQIIERDQGNPGAQQPVRLRSSRTTAEPVSESQVENVISGLASATPWVPPPPPQPAQQLREAQASTSPATPDRIDLNSATETQLAGLPGVGIILAKRAVIERQRRGGFGAVEEFCDALGLKPHIAEHIRPLVEIGPKGNLQGSSSSGRVIDY